MADPQIVRNRETQPFTLPESLVDYRDLVIWLLCGVALILWGLRLWGYGTITPMVAVPSVALIAWGLFVLVWHGRSDTDSSTTRWVLGITLALTLVALAMWTYSQLITAPAYGTDEMAFDQWAAHIWMHGINPYGRSLAAAFSRYQVSPNGYTWTLTGKPVTLLSYPAQSFLTYIPFMWLGWTTQVAAGVNVLAWAVGLVVLFVGVPRSIKPLTIVLASLSIYVSYAVGGVTDALFVPFLILAARAWDQYPQKRGWAAFWSPFWFGMAMGIKQTPWVIWPFLLFGIFAEARKANGPWKSALHPTLRYALISGLVFLVPNIPFILLNPVTWLKGILTPLLASTIPNGQGLISLSLFLHVGGGSLLAYTVLSGVLLLGLLLAYYLTYPRMKAWTFIVPSVALFVATRSFGSYLVMLVPATIMALLTTQPMVAEPMSQKTKALLGGVGIAVLASLGAALGIQSPLSMALTGVHTTGQLATVDQVHVEATNNTDHTIHPHFTANMSGTFTAFWNRLSGPTALRAHQTATYILAAPNFYSQPALTGGFQMVAFTAKTKTISHTAAYVPSTWHVALIPDAINHPIPYGKPLTVTAEILNRMDQPVHAKGIPIYLGQVIYAQRGLQYGQAIINNGDPGETPVSANTNNEGQATFTIRDVHSETNPVYFEANLVDNHDYYPYGYSQILPVRFGSH